MSAHTPGPWKALLHDGGAFEIVIDDSSFDAVLGLGVVLAARSSWPHRASESHANARLFSAAGELLSAVEAAIWLMNDENNGLPPLPGRREDLHRQLMAAAEKAYGPDMFSKAEGK